MSPIVSFALPAGHAFVAHGSRLRAALLSLLTLAATFLALVALLSLIAHPSTGAGHSMADTGTTGTATHQMASATLVTDMLPVTSTRPTTHATRTGPTMTLAAPAKQPALCSQHNSLGGGDSASMLCSAVLMVNSNAVLARMPSDPGLVFASGGFVNDTFRAIPLHLHRPSLTLLSISRV
ncbi:hypothetical protein [Cryobacterium fucosi]|uniref:Uncharacterized protein n=1 Tax=Cryobacterium fucosi TaxID=1259157 RepID=A0A4R9B9M2_9MICO|nr:hypothetical protein [Cryobacterium fucosi]TFD78274.1 hypothetical protein E3T48_07500 [Cryobacterium fucosi]